MADATDNVTDIREPDRICMDCGKTLVLVLCTNWFTDYEGYQPVKVILCPRCSSRNHQEYVKAEHEHVEIKVPENYQHPMEEKARELFNRVSEHTGWREVKVRFWFQQVNPLLGNVSPEWMIMNGNAERLEKFISDAEYFSAEYQGG